MVRVKDIISIMETYFPPYLAEDWDNSGLQLGSRDKMVKTVCVSLDLDDNILKRALEQEADLIITHHPLFFRGIKSINYATFEGRMIKKLVQADVSVFSAHTNLDSARYGLNQLLAEKLGLKDIQPLDKGKMERLYKLVVYVPQTHTEKVREAISQAGAGYIGKYSDCTFRTPGIGTFKPGDSTNPFIGKKGLLEEVEEYRLETVVCQHQLQQVVRSMQSAHPYEEVAYDLYRLENQGQIFSLGRKGNLENKISLGSFAQIVKHNLNLQSLRVVGDLETTVKKVAVISGAGASMLNKAAAAGVDVLVTGDIKYHEAQEAKSMGLNLIDAGHQGTEQIVISYLGELLEREMRGREIKIIPLFPDQCFINV